VYLVREFVAPSSIEVCETEQGLAEVMRVWKESCLLADGELVAEPSLFTDCIASMRINCHGEILDIHYNANPLPGGLAHKDIQAIAWYITAVSRDTLPVQGGLSSD
jgi:hypothetical protein